jgi:hypothetical protein
LKKIVLLSILATSFLAAPAVQAQMGRHPGPGNRGAMQQSKGAWSGNHGDAQRAPRFEPRGQRFAPGRARAENRHYYQPPRSRQWAQRPNQRFGPPQAWAHNNSRAPYQARNYGNYRQPYGPAAYGPRPGYQPGPQVANGPGGRTNSNYNTSSTPYRPAPGTYNGSRPSMAPSGIPGTITRTSATPPSGAMGNRAGGWTPSSGTTSGSGWSGHRNTRLSSGPAPTGSTTAVTSD